MKFVRVRNVDDRTVGFVSMPNGWERLGRMIRFPQCSQAGFQIGDAKSAMLAANPTVDMEVVEFRHPEDVAVRCCELRTEAPLDVLRRLRGFVERE